jgi:hypothetical protein
MPVFSALCAGLHSIRNYLDKTFWFALSASSDFILVVILDFLKLMQLAIDINWTSPSEVTYGVSELKAHHK